jgi:hypothetical protein
MTPVILSRPEAGSHQKPFDIKVFGCWVAILA